MIDDEKGHFTGRRSFMKNVTLASQVCSGKAG